MALSFKKGTITAPTGATGNQSYTGVGFQPKAVLFFGTPQTAAGYAAGASHFMGACTASANRVVSVAADDAVATTNTGRRWSSADCISILSGGSPTVDALAAVVSLDADGFTLNWTDTASSAWIVHYIAIGGSDLLSAAVGNFGAPASTGNQSTTGVGFLPDAIIFFSNVDTGASPSTTSGANFTLGVATGTAAGEQWASTVSNADVLATSSTSSSFYTGSCLIHGASGGTGLLSQAALNSFDADGFTLNWTTAGSSGGVTCYLALRTTGGNLIFAGNDSQKTSTGTKATTGAGGTPVGLLLAGANLTTTTGFSTTAGKFTVGGTDGSSQGAIWVDHVDATASNSNVNQRTTTSVAISHSTSDTTTNAEAAYSSFDGDGFTVNWTTADATARTFGYLAFLTAAGGGGGSGGAAAKKMMTMMGGS